MTIRVKTEKELEDLAKELLRLLVNVRHHTKKWELDHGSLAKSTKKLWEQKADKYLTQIQLETNVDNKSDKVTIEQ